jgi:hypothetical protein
VTAATFRLSLFGALAVLCAVVAAGCTGNAGGAAGSCGLVVHFGGRTYGGNGVQVQPRPGRPVGVGVIPGCNDGEPAASLHVHLATIPGVPARIALQAREWNDAVFVNWTQRPLPRAVTHLFHAPTCRAADAPIRLRGPWRGILKPDGTTELTMVPPYDVNLLVRESSVARYARAFLTVRVPPRLGRPLTRQDIRVSLWKQGHISATVTCSGGRYVATAISASDGHGAT